MTDKMTRREMMDMMARHDAYEAAGDLEGTMSTVSANPVWEVHPLGYRITGRPALSEYYRRVLRSAQHLVPGLMKKNIWAEDNGLAIEFELEMTEGQGNPFICHFIVALKFEDGLVQAERAFLAPKQAKIMEQRLGPDFIDIPGVTMISKAESASPGPRHAVTT